MINALVFLVLALLSGLGVGSAGLPVVYLTLVRDVPQLTAQGASLFFFALSSSASLLFQLLRKNVHRAVLLLIPSGLLGAWLGSRLALSLPTALLRTLFGVFLLVTGALGLFRARGA